MFGKNAHDGPADAVSDVIAFDAHDRAIWPAEDLRAALHQRLRLRLYDSPDLSAEWAAVRELAEEAAPPILTFMDLLHHPHPRLELLWSIKDLAKRSQAERRNTLPPEVWLVVYYGCIAAGLLRWNDRITRLDDDQLRRGLNWTVRQDWLDESTRRLFLDALRYLRSSLPRWRK